MCHFSHSLLARKKKGEHQNVLVCEQTDDRNWAQMLRSALGAHDDALHVKCYEQRTRRRRETNVHSPILLRRRGISYVEELVGSCEPKVFAQSNAQ